MTCHFLKPYRSNNGSKNAQLAQGIFGFKVREIGDYAQQDCRDQASRSCLDTTSEYFRCGLCWKWFVYVCSMASLDIAGSHLAAHTPCIIKPLVLGAFAAPRQVHLRPLLKLVAEDAVAIDCEGDAQDVPKAARG